jgi:hypothetical protein
MPVSIDFSLRAATGKPGDRSREKVSPRLQAVE